MDGQTKKRIAIMIRTNKPKINTKDEFKSRSLTIKFWSLLSPLGFARWKWIFVIVIFFLIFKFDLVSVEWALWDVDYVVACTKPPQRGDFQILKKSFRVRVCNVEAIFLSHRNSINGVSRAKENFRSFHCLRKLVLHFMHFN